MAITPKHIIDTAVGIGREAVSRGVELAGKLRSDQRAAPPTTPGTPVAKPAPRSRTSGSPSTVGAAKPGKPRGPKSATAPKKTAKSR